jgi:hypothetical protein
VEVPIPTSKTPAKRALKLSPNQRKNLLVPGVGDDPIDDDLAHKLASALLCDTENLKVELAGTQGVDEATIQPGEGA